MFLSRKTTAENNVNLSIFVTELEREAKFLSHRFDNENVICKSRI